MADPSETAQRVREGVRLSLAGDWRRAHEIAQQYEHDLTACWLHAVVHRIEGDVSNARYWYRRCGRPIREDVSTQDELREIQSVLEGHEEA